MSSCWILSLTLSSFLADDPAPCGPASGSVEPVAWDWRPVDEVFAAARADGRRVLLYLWAPESKHCRDTFGSVFGDPSCAPILARYHCLAASAATEPGAALVARHHVGVVPTILVLEPDGRAEDAIVGTITGPSFRVEMQRIEAGRETVSDFRERVSSNPKDLSARLDLAAKLRHVGDQAGYQEIVASIREADPQGKTVVGAQLALREMMQDTLDAANQDPARYDLRRVYRWVRKARHDLVAHEAWDWLAARERERGELRAARGCLKEAVDVLPPDALMDWRAEVVMQYWADRETLDRKEKRFALDLAKHTADLALRYLASQGGKDDGTPSGNRSTDAFVAGKLISLACAWALDGKPQRAREVLELVETLSPGDAELADVVAQILAHR